MDKIIIQTLLDVCAGVCLAAMGFFLREIWEAIKELRRDLALLREDIPKTYVNKDDYRENLKEINFKLNRLLEALGQKADRSCN
jgi:hypothetical protein